MKKLFVFSLGAIALLFSACERDNINDDFVPMDDILTVSKSIESQVMTKGGETEPLTLTFNASYSISEDSILAFGLSSNSELIDNAYLNEAFKELLEEELGENYTNLSELESRITKSAQCSGDIQLATCLRECKEEYERHNGRGACRTDCWIDFAVDLLEIVLPIILNNN